MSTQPGHKRINSAYNQPFSGNRLNPRNTVVSLNLGMSGNTNVNIPLNKKNPLKMEGELSMAGKNSTQTRSQNLLNKGPGSISSNSINKGQISNRSLTPSSRTGFANGNFKSNPSNSKLNNNPFTKVKKIDISPSPNTRTMSSKFHNKSNVIPRSSRENSFNPLNLTSVSKSKLNETGFTNRNSHSFRSVTPTPDLKNARSKSREYSPNIKKMPSSKSPNFVQKKSPFEQTSLKQLSKISNPPMKKLTTGSLTNNALYNKSKLVNVASINSLGNKKFGTPIMKKVVTGSLLSSNNLQHNNNTNDVSTNSTFKSKLDNNGTNNSNIVIPIGKNERNENSNVMGANNFSRMNFQKEKEHVDFREITTSPLLRKKPENSSTSNNNKENNQKLLIDNGESLLNNSLFNKFNMNQVNQKMNNGPTNNMVNVNMNVNINVNNLNANLSNKNLDKVCRKSITMTHEYTKVGYSGQGVKKVNQDNYFIFKNFVGNPNHIYMAVCDGHGVLGHEVSGYLRENLPSNLNNQLKLKNKTILTHNVNEIIEDVFLETNYKLQTHETIDTTFSGSTCVSLIFTPEKVVTANVGDSRAVLGRCVNGEWVSHDLTRDHKPNDKDESLRIRKRGGRIQPFRDEDGEFIGPARVWLREDDIPGLAMSRSFGDRVAASVGVVAEPEIFEYKFQEEDKFFIVASDGVWEFIQSSECVNIIKEFYLQNDIVGCCEYIYKESAARWMKEEEVIDDITMIIVFLE